MGANYSPKIVTDGLIFMVDFADRNCFPGSGTTVTDLVSTKTLSAENSPTITSAHPGYMSSATGGKRITRQSNDLGSVLGNEITLASWWRGTGAGGASANARIMEVYAVDSAPSSGHALLRGSSNGTPTAWLNDNGNSGYSRFYTITAATTIADNIWTYQVCTYSSPTVKLYLNGTLSQTGTSAVTTALDDALNVTIGAYEASTSNYFMTGDISICKIYNRELTAAEVSQNFNAQRSRFGV
jgi:hypothetical protein